MNFDDLGLNDLTNDIEVVEKPVQPQKVANTKEEHRLLVNGDESETKYTLELARQLLALELEIKELKDDQKELKAEAKANGVAISKVSKSISTLKAKSKQTPTDIDEQNQINNVLSSDVDIQTQISELIKK